LVGLFNLLKVIIGVVIGAGGLLVGVGLTLFFVLLRKRRRKQKRHQKMTDNSHQPEQTEENAVFTNQNKTSLTLSSVSNSFGIH
jgi:hypothetical protein